MLKADPNSRPDMLTVFILSCIFIMLDGECLMSEREREKEKEVGRVLPYS